MKNKLLLLLVFLISYFSSIAQYNDRQLIINTTGNGFDRTTFNGIDPEKWIYIQKFANLSYNGQDASVTAVRLHVTWHHYEPTIGNYQRAKIVQAVQAIAALKPGMKVALHFPYQRDGRIIEQYFGDEDISRTATGTLVAKDVGWSNPSIFSAYGKQRFYAYVDDVLAQLAANSLMDKILYVEMGNGSAEEFANPYITINGQIRLGSYEDKAVQAWRTEYLPCRYPGQTNVTWNNNTYSIASAPVAENPWGDWSNEHQKEYHRFISWGLMNFYKGFRDVVKNRNSALKVVYFVSDFGSQQGNLYFMHNATLPKALQEFDGIYTSDGTWIYDLDRKIMPIDVIKGTNANKIAAIEFDQEDLGQANPPQPNSPIDANLTLEWMSRAFKHGVNHINLAMFFNDTQIDQLKTVFATLRSTYLNSGYTPPARQTPVTQNIFPHVFTSTGLFSTWGSSGGANWSTTDNNPVSINMIDDGYWENIWSCSSNPCDFNISASGPSGSVTAGSSVTLNSSCTGQCSGISYSWSGNGISGNGSSISFNSPNTAGTYTYTLTASKTGCADKTATTTVTTTTGGGGTGCVPNKVRLYFRDAGQCCMDRLPGAKIQGSNNGSSWTDLYTFSTNGTGAFQEFNFSNTTSYTSVRFVASATGWGELRELEFYNGNTKLSGTPFGTDTYANAFDGNTSTEWHAPTTPGPNNYAGLNLTGCSGGGCTTPSAPSLSASPATISSGGNSTLSAIGCSGGTITWSDGLGTGTSKSVNPTATKTYTATCSIGTCTSTAGSVTVTVTTPGGPNCNTLSGFFDGANCYFLDGWVYDSNNPNAVVNVDIYEGSTLIAGNIPANNFRQDLLDAGMGNGVHAFSIPTPAAFKDGQTHTITIKVSGCSYQLNNSPRNISSCSNSLVLGTESDIINSQSINKLLVSPNPNNGLFNASFYIPKGKKATLVVQDIQGRTLFIKNYNGTGLVQTEKLNLLGKSSGTIFVQLRKEGEVEVKKINITR